MSHRDRPSVPSPRVDAEEPIPFFSCRSTNNMKQTLSILILMAVLFALSCSKDSTGTSNTTTTCTGAAKSFANYV